MSPLVGDWVEVLELDGGEGMVEKIHAAAGEDFNIDSPQQLSHVLFDVLGLPTFGLKRTKRGFYSTNAKVLGDLANEHRIVAEVLDYRERSKIKSTYLDALPALVAGDGRIHTTLNQTVTATGRLSSSDPNLQNIPTRSELGHRVRQAFTVPEGSVFLACDYSQIELRLLAHLSGDEHLVAAFCEGADFHAATAARVFGVPVEEVTPQLRSRAKAVNFGIVYGQQAFGLASSLKIPRAEAQEMIDRYFEAYPGVRAFLDEAVRIARLSRAAGCGDWIKIEVISDTRHLLPDGYETAKATETLAKEGFTVLPYMNPDLYVARDLVNAGAAAVMPLGAPIGTNRGLQTKEMVRILIEEISLPIVVDAGIGKPSQACEAMEMGAAACLVNTAIATAGDPVRMGAAFGEAVRAGRNAFLAKAGPVLQGGVSASSPLTGFLGGHDEGAAS